ncbi:MAG: sigma-54-dependent Fis family transcriptional regulator [Nevskiaceae bacterium]|nr:MAG: sigma-54-dependent Fis family transcriptional regulator [Nevskiaceae bacterium]
MPNSVSTAKEVVYKPEDIWHARHAFFDRGTLTEGLVDAAVLRSWERCSTSGRGAGESVDFEPVHAGGLRELLQAHRDLLEAGRPELAHLASSVADAGYAALLTDSRGSALAVDGSIAQRSPVLRRAFRAGVDLSERAIGTNAMALALKEERPVRVLGAEHFYTDAQIFHCSAAPVFDAQGTVIGAVDVSRDVPGKLDSTLWLAARCAQRIELRLFCARPAAVRVEVDVCGEHANGTRGSGAWLAFGVAGELIAANRAARKLMGLPFGLLDVDFEGMFEERFGNWLGELRRSPDGARMRLQDGLRLHALPLNEARSQGGHAVAVAAPRLAQAARPVFGDSRMDREFDRALRAARAGLPLLVTGETGTGKEVAARALHAAGARRTGPFVALNCAAIPSELLAGELFGHVEGAYTGARRSGAVGKIEAAQHGTLFLDEIGDMPITLQTSLLRVLDSKEIVRLGSNRAQSIDVDIICATHRQLPDLVSRGLFREDLMYRVSGHVMYMVPLRERRDFDVLLDVLIQRCGGAPSQADEGLRQALRMQRWPGNVRQLALAIQRALALNDPGQPLSSEDFALEERSHARSGPSAPSGKLRVLEEDAIECALVQCRGNVTLAAKQLGIGRATLYRRLKERSRQG